MDTTVDTPAPVTAPAPQQAPATGQVVVAEQKPAEPPVPPGHVAMNFHFRTEKIRNEKGEEIGTGKKHPDVKMILPIPSDEQIIDFIVANGKEAAFLREVIADSIKLAARGQINEYREANPDGVVTPAIFDLTKLTFSAVAAMEKADRATDIPEEVFNSMFEDYKQVLSGLGTPPERIAKHIVLFKNQFRVARYDKPALNILKDRLNLYAAKTENMEDNKEVFELLVNKIDKYLKADEKKLVEAL